MGRGHAKPLGMAWVGSVVRTVFQSSQYQLPAAPGQSFRDILERNEAGRNQWEGSEKLGGSRMDRLGIGSRPTAGTTRFLAQQVSAMSL